MKTMLLKVILFCHILLTCTYLGCGAPLRNNLGRVDLYDEIADYNYNEVVFLAAAVLILFVLLVTGCVCCPHNGIKALSHQNGIPIARRPNNSTCNLESASEFTIFPPPSAIVNQPHSLGLEDKVTFEPLPEIFPRGHANSHGSLSLRPAHFGGLLKKKSSLHDWFGDPNSNFSRGKLQYLKEVGNGWFGRVVEGEAHGITTEQSITSVTVKILREEASPSEHIYFLHEMRPYRDLLHPNVVRLLGRCLESDPFLIIMEHTMMDLKSYLIDQRRKNAESLLQDGILLRMACNIVSGLQYMHESGFTHVDLAAHNCFVSMDLTIKIGDFGTSFETYKEDYYCLGDIALPLRWYSPETLHCTETTIETKEITKEANIWALGVVFWEMIEFGKLPYIELTDDEVLHKVIIEKILHLEEPQSPCVHREQMYQIMKLCWKSEAERPKANKIATLLNHLYDNCDVPSDSESFEVRWNALQSKVTEHNLPQSQEIALKFENDFVLDSKPQNMYDVSLSPSECDSNTREASPLENSEFISHRASLDSFLSPSLCVLTGSIGDISESFCMQMNNMSNSDAKSSHTKDAKELSSCWQPPLKQPNSQNDGVTQEEISDTVKDIEMALATQSVLSYNNLQCIPEKQQKNDIPNKLNIQDAEVLHKLTEDSSALSIKSVCIRSLGSEEELPEVYCKTSPHCVEDISSIGLTTKIIHEKDSQFILDNNSISSMEYEDKKRRVENSNIYTFDSALTDSLLCEHELKKFFETKEPVDKQEECLFEVSASVQEQNISYTNSLPHHTALQNGNKTRMVNYMYQDKCEHFVDTSKIELKNSCPVAAALTNDKPHQVVKLDCLQLLSNVKHIDNSQVPIFIASDSPLYNDIALESECGSAKYSSKHQGESTMLENSQKVPNVIINVTENSSFEGEEFESACQPKYENIQYIDQESLSHTSDFDECKEECIPIIESIDKTPPLTSTPNKESCCPQVISITQDNLYGVKNIYSDHQEMSLINSVSNSTTGTFYETALAAEENGNEATVGLSVNLYETGNDQCDNEVEKLSDYINSVEKKSEQMEEIKHELVQMPEITTMNTRLYTNEVSNKNSLIKDIRSSEMQNISKPSNISHEPCITLPASPDVGVVSSVKKSIICNLEEPENSSSYINKYQTSINDDLETIAVIQDSNIVEYEPTLYFNNTGYLQDGSNVVDLDADSMLSKYAINDQCNGSINTDQDDYNLQGIQQLQRIKTFTHKSDFSKSAEKDGLVLHNDEPENANPDSTEHSFVYQKSNLNIVQLNCIHESPYEKPLSFQDSLFYEDNYVPNHTTASKNRYVEGKLKNESQDINTTIDTSKQSGSHMQSLSFEYLIENSMADNIIDRQKSDSLVQLESKDLCTRQFTETTDLTNEQYSNSLNILDEESSDNFTSVSSISDLQKGLIIEERVCISPEKEVKIMSDKTEHLIDDEKTLSEIAGDAELCDEFESSIEIASSTCNALNSGHIYLSNEPDTVTVEDLETGQKLLIPSSETLCDPLDNDDVLRIDTETNEAILVDSSESLVGFVPSRSIELLQECPMISNIEEEEDSSGAQVYTQQEGEVSHNSPASTSSAICSGSEDVFITEDEHSEAPESEPLQDIFEISSLPVYEHLVTDDENIRSPEIHTTAQYSFNLKGTVSPEKQNSVSPKCEKTNQSNASFQDSSEDVMFSREPSRSIHWLSDETLGDNIQNGSNAYVIIESEEILVGGDANKTNIQKMTASSVTVDDINPIKENFLQNDNSDTFFNQLSTCFSPYGSTASSPCRDMVYTPDFESDTEETSSGTSCSSTSGSFECIHNKFKNTTNISEIKDDRDEYHQINKHQVDSSPLPVFSKSWDRHATPTRSLLKTPEKKVLPVRKSVSFHEEDPPLIFQYPPASDSSEDEFVDEEEFSWHVDYTSYADWELQVGDDDEIPEDIVEVEELDSEPESKHTHSYRSISLRPLRSPMLYSLTDLSDEDLELPEMTGSSQFSLLPCSHEENKSVLPESKEELPVHKMNELGQFSKKNTTEVLDIEDLLLEGMESGQPTVIKHSQPIANFEREKSGVESIVVNDQQAEECPINSEESCKDRRKEETEFQQSLKCLFNERKNYGFEICQHDNSNFSSENYGNFCKIPLTLSTQDFHINTDEESILKSESFNKKENINEHSEENVSGTEENTKEGIKISDSKPQMIEIRDEEKILQISELDLISSVDLLYLSQSKENVNVAGYLEKSNLYSFVDNKITDVCKNDDASVKSSAIGALHETPDPSDLELSRNTNDNISNSHKIPSLFSCYLSDEIKDTKETICTKSKSSDNFCEKVTDINVSHNIPSCLVELDSSKMSKFIVSDKKSDFSEVNILHGAISSCVSNSISELDILINKNEQEIDYFKFIDNNKYSSSKQEKKSNETNNTSLQEIQENYQSGNHCLPKEKEQDSAISSGEVSPAQLPADAEIIGNEGNLEKTDTHLSVSKNQNTLNTETVVLQNLQVTTKQETLLKIPLIIISNADEYSMDSDAEQFLNNQINMYEEDEYIDDFHNSEDFTITSKFSYDPFDDTFGYFDGQASEDEDFVEAYNSVFNSWDIRELSEKSFGSNDLFCINSADNIVAENEVLIRTERSASLPLFSKPLDQESKRAIRYGSLQEDLHCILKTSLDSSHVVTEPYGKSLTD